MTRAAFGVPLLLLVACASDARSDASALAARRADSRTFDEIAASAPADRTETPPSARPAFRIRPVKSVEELRCDAAAASPPDFSGEFREPDWVEIVALDPTIRLDLKYATSDNFLGVRVYESARAFLQRPAAEALVRAHRRLRSAGFGLLVHDAYRPWSVTKVFWDATPVEQRAFVGDPSQGSRHNRGCAVDVTLCDLATGAAVSMPSAFDEFSEAAYAFADAGTPVERWRRDLLRCAMEHEGFVVLPHEWWHFDWREWRLYPVSNTPFDAAARAASR